MFLHDGRKPGRLSLVRDCVEPLLKLVRAVFGYAATHEFERQDFLVFVHKITHEKTIRLAPPLAKEIAALTVKTVSVRECVKVVNWLITKLKRPGFRPSCKNPKQGSNPLAITTRVILPAVIPIA